MTKVNKTTECKLLSRETGSLELHRFGTICSTALTAVGTVNVNI